MSPLMAALAAVTESLRRCRVAVIRYSPSSALHRLEYEHDGDTIAAVGWADGLFVDDEVPADVAALVRAHAHLAVSAPSVAVPDVTTNPSFGGIPA